MSANQPIRILELRSVRGTGGGPEKTILLGALMSDPQFQVTVCYMRDERDRIFGIDNKAAKAGVIDYIEVREKHSFDVRVWPKLRRLIRERSIDIVHSHDYKTNLLALLLSRAESVKALSTVHGWTGHSFREVWGYYPADKRVLARFPRVVAVSSEIGRELIRCGANPAGVTTVLNGIDHRQFRRDPARVAEARAALGAQEGDLVIGAVGRAEPQKRFDLLLEAFTSIVKRFPHSRLFIVGDGSQRQALDEQVTTLNLRDRCRLVGHMDDVVPAYHAFDLLVQSSDYEGTPNAVLEAMAFEVPIVATAAGGTAEIVRDGVDGRIVPIGRVDLLIDAVTRALEDPADTAAMAHQARLRVEGELSFETRVRRIEGIYREMMQRA
ncbi:MAG TPA: glycosyltransferase [Vicinamibacterales bacterium]